MSKTKTQQNGWQEVILGDISFPVSETFDFRNIEKVHFLNTSDIYDGQLLHNELVYVRGLPGQAKKRFNKNDILFSEIRPQNRRFMLVNFDSKYSVASTKLIVLRSKDDVDSKFLYLWITSKDILEEFQMIAEGRSGSFPQITFDSVKKTPLLLPPLPEQKEIAEVLSSLDEKIELLHRQNKTLEDMAQALFRKWFVEEAKEDWEVKLLSYFGDVICGKTPSKKVHEYFSGPIPFIKIPDMHGKTFIFDTTDTLTEQGKNSQKNKTLPPKSICVSCIATVGLVSMNAFESQTNQQINSIIPSKDEFRYFVYLFMKSSKDLLEAMASGGTATMNLNTGNFAKIMLPTADEKVLGEFNSKIESLFNKIFSNQSQICTLENMRDTLLPKLMSGAVRLNF